MASWSLAWVVPRWECLSYLVWVAYQPLNRDNRNFLKALSGLQSEKTGSLGLGVEGSLENLYFLARSVRLMQPAFLVGVAGLKLATLNLVVLIRIRCGVGRLVVKGIELGCLVSPLPRTSCSLLSKGFGARNLIPFPTRT